MRPIRTLTALALAVCLTGTSGAVGAVVSGAKGGKHLIHGKVVSVQMDASNKGTGTITVLVHHHKKGTAASAGGAATAPVEKTFKVSSGTKYAMVQGTKGAAQETAADVSAVQKGGHVVIHLSGGVATDVKIVRKGKGAKKST